MKAEKDKKTGKMVNSVSLYRLAGQTPKIYEKRLCYKKRSGGMDEKFSYYTKCRF